MSECDLRQTRSSCMDTYKQLTDKDKAVATFPIEARHSLNRCNLPAVILGGLMFQRHPTPLSIDGVKELHAPLFKELDVINEQANRAHYFMDYMSVHFRLHALDEAGYEEEQRLDRSKANYLRLLRGWAFNPDGKEAAVIKRWVESRFGLIPRFHITPIHSTADDSYQHFLSHAAEGVYNTNALESQLDLIYSYCQYELHREQPERSYRQLYRGSNFVEQLNSKNRCDKGHSPHLLNNINSFSEQPERADEFGDTVIEVSVPHEKIFFYSELLPGCLKGEGEVMVLGGAYCARTL